MLDSGIGDFFRQLPPILIIMFCGSSLALVAVLAVMINGRGKRARAAETTAAAPAPVMSASFETPDSFEMPVSGDMPDLDDLLSVEPEAEPVARSARPVIRGAMTLQTSAGETVDVVEVMTILRDTEGDGLLIRIGDQLYRNPPALADAEFKRRFNSTVRDLYQSIGDTSLSKKSTDETPAVTDASAATEPAPRTAAPPPAQQPVNVPSGTAMPGDLPKFKMPDTVEKPRRGRKAPNEPIPEINIADAIEEYLQYKISMTPEFAGRAVHVRSAVGGGLRIDVGERSFETVGEVDDPAVRAFLQSTIEEWQSRQ